MYREIIFILIFTKKFESDKALLRLLHIRIIVDPFNSHTPRLTQILIVHGVAQLHVWISAHLVEDMVVAFTLRLSDLT